MLDHRIQGKNLFLTLLKELFKIGRTLQKWKTFFLGSSTFGSPSNFKGNVVRDLKRFQIQ